jgi:hypothetical protein
MAFVSDRAGTPDVFRANGMGADEEAVTLPRPGAPFTPTSAESDPAFSPVADPQGVARAVPDGLSYLAMTTTALGARRLVFLDQEAHAAGATRVLHFPEWTIAQGAGMLAPQLEPPNTEQSQVAFAPNGRLVAYRDCDVARHRGRVLLLVLDGPSSQLVAVG